MPLNLDRIEKRAVKTGVKKSKKLGHIITPDELLRMRVQTMPHFWRIFLALFGLGLIAISYFGWPSDDMPTRILEGVVGSISLIFGVVGIRRTFSTILDSFDAADAVGGVIDLISESLSGFDL